MTTDELIRLCRDCAGQIYGTRPPSGRYAEAVARLLMGTAAAESLLKYRRQIGFSMENPGGAWGLWQTEQGAVADSIRYLAGRRDVLAAAVRFAPSVEEAMCAGALPRLHMIRDDDRLAVVFARLHYLRVAEAVPDDLRGQAGYWKRYYNTRRGKGTVEGYMEKWRVYVEPGL